MLKNYTNYKRIQMIYMSILLLFFVICGLTFFYPNKLLIIFSCSFLISLFFSALIKNIVLFIIEIEFSLRKKTILNDYYNEDFNTFVKIISNMQNSLNTNLISNDSTFYEKSYKFFYEKGISLKDCLDTLKLRSSKSELTILYHLYHYILILRSQFMFNAFLFGYKVLLPI